MRLAVVTAADLRTVDVYHMDDRVSPGPAAAKESLNGRQAFEMARRTHCGPPSHLQTTAATASVTADCARPPVKPNRPPDVGGVSLTSAAPHERVVDQRLPIDARSGELEAERAGHRRFGPAGVGRAVTRRIAPYGARRVPRRGARRQRGGQNQPQRGKTRRRQIDEIVEPRRRPAERCVAFILDGRSCCRRC